MSVFCQLARLGLILGKTVGNALFCFGMGNWKRTRERIRGLKD